MIETAKAWQNRLAYLYFTVIILAYMVVVWTAATPPSFVDYPNWVYQGVLFYRVLIHHPVTGYALKHYPVPNSLTTVGLGLLDTVLPWQSAAKLWICLYLAFAAFATWLLCRSMRSESWKLIVVLPGIAFLNLNFWYGHISFEIGMCGVLLLLAALVRGVSTPWIMGLLTALFFVHMEAYACALLLFGVWCGVMGLWSRLWVAMPSIGLTIWYAVARFTTGNHDGGTLKEPSRYGSPDFWAYKINTYFKAFGYVNACRMNGLSQTEAVYGRSLYLLLLGVSLCIAVICLTLTLRFLVATRPRSGHRIHKIVGIVVLTLLAVSLVLPQSLLGTADPGSRLLLVAVVMAMFLVDWEGLAGTLLVCLSMTICLANLWQFSKINPAPSMQGSARNLPRAILRFGHVEPEVRVEYYKALKEGRMQETIFPTGIFLRETPQ